MSYYQFNRKKYCTKQKKSTAIVVVKKKLLNIVEQIKDVLKEKANNRYRDLSKKSEKIVFKKQVKRYEKKCRFIAYI